MFLNTRLEIFIFKKPLTWKLKTSCGEFKTLIHSIFALFADIFFKKVAMATEKDFEFTTTEREFYY